MFLFVFPIFVLVRLGVRIASHLITINYSKSQLFLLLHDSIAFLMTRKHSFERTIDWSMIKFCCRIDGPMVWRIACLVSICAFYLRTNKFLKRNWIKMKRIFKRLASILHDPWKCAAPKKWFYFNITSVHLVIEWFFLLETFWVRVKSFFTELWELKGLKLFSTA